MGHSLCGICNCEPCECKKHVMCDIPPIKEECYKKACIKLGKCVHSVVCELCTTENECVNNDMCKEFQHSLGENNGKVTEESSTIKRPT